MRLAKNSFYSFLGSALPLLVTLITLPIFVSLIGAERYGVLAIGWLVLGSFGAADFGIGRAITQRIAKLKNHDTQHQTTAVWSALISMIGFGIVSALALSAFAWWYFSGPLQAAEGLRSEALSAVWILALGSPVVAINGVLSGSLMGLERFRLVAASTVLTSSGLLLFPLAMAYLFSTELPHLIAAALLARILGSVLLAGVVWQQFFRSQKIAFSCDELKGLTSFGAWIMVSALVSPFILFADRFVIGALQDAIAVAAYAIPYQVASRTLLLPVAVSQALYPRFASDDELTSSVRCAQYTAFVGLVFTPIVVVLICLSEPLLSLWLGDQLDQRSILVAQIILAGCWFNGVALVSFVFIQARGNPRFTALLHTIELPLFLALLWQLGTQFGLAGFAAAFVVRCAIDCFALTVKAGLVRSKEWYALVLPALLVAIAIAVGVSVSDWMTLVGAAALLGFFALIAIIFQTPRHLRVQIAELPIVGVLLRRAWQ